MRTPFAAFLALCLTLPLALAACDGTGKEEAGSLSGEFILSMPARKGGEIQVFALSLDGRRLRQITDVPKRDHSGPAVSPDGRSIAFASYKEGAYHGIPALYLMDRNGRNSRAVLFTPDGDKTGGEPIWHPNGREIAYARCIGCEYGGRNSEIFVADLATGTQRKLTDHPAPDRLPAWSPDGRLVAFMSERDYVGQEGIHGDLYVANDDGSDVRRLTYTDGVGRSAWSADGRRLAFSASGVLHHVDVQTGTVSQIGGDFPPGSYGVASVGQGTHLLFNQPIGERVVMHLTTFDGKLIRSFPLPERASFPRWAPRVP